MKNIFISICLMLAATTCAQADSLYRWIDKDGKVYYGDRPDEDAVGAEQKKFGAPVSAGDDDLSYTVRKAKQDFPVTLYLAPNCGDVCVQARSLLNKRGIPFTEKNLATKEDIDAFKAKTGVNYVPVLAVGKTVLTSFEAGRWHGELDVAGYPKTAPYGSRPAAPAASQPVVAAPAEK